MCSKLPFCLGWVSTPYPVDQKADKSFSLLADIIQTPILVSKGALYIYYISVSLRINEREGGDLADAQSVKLYLGAWCMCIPHLKSRCTETDSEQSVLYIPFAHSSKFLA